MTRPASPHHTTASHRSAFHGYAESSSPRYANARRLSIRRDKRPRGTVRVLCICLAVLAAATFATSLAVVLAVLHPARLRNCVPQYRTAASEDERGLRIAIVTMRDLREQAASPELRELLGLPAEGPPLDILALTWPNKARYAQRHGYALVNGTDRMDPSRPPSWSKLPVVRGELAAYDWVFYLDADTFVTNGSVRVEDVVPARGGPDLVLTSDTSGVNAGSWLVRNSAWSAHFLGVWWDSVSFIRRGAGDTKSGDNDALKFLLATMEPSERHRHVAVAPQCAFNSFIWRTSARQLVRLLMHPFQMLAGIWHPRDFVLHLAGFQDKFAALQSVGRFLGPTQGAREAHLSAHMQRRASLSNGEAGERWRGAFGMRRAKPHTAIHDPDHVVVKQHLESNAAHLSSSDSDPGV